MEVGQRRAGGPTGRARRRVGGGDRVRRPRSRGCVRALPLAAQARPAARAAAAPRVGHAARRPRVARRPLRRLLPRALSHPRARGAVEAPVLADGPRHPPRAGRVRRTGPQPGDLPGRDRGPPARPHLHGVRAAEVPQLAPGQGVHPRDAAVAGVGLRVLRRGPHRRRAHPPAAGEARRGARRTSSRPCAPSATASASPAGVSEHRAPHLASRTSPTRWLGCAMDVHGCIPHSPSMWWCGG